MTPLEFARRYWELEVPVEENGVTNWTRVRVASYRIGLEAGGTAKDAFLAKVRPHINEKHEEITVQVKTALGEIKTKTYRSRQELAQNVADPFYGKGSPEEVQVVLQLAVRFGLVKREGLEKYCKDDHIGLDCSGFVGNYIWHVLLGNS
jgi:hypothetical protein